MNIKLTMKRIQNAQRAMVRAQNPWFRQYWKDTSEKLLEQMVATRG